MPSTRSGTSEAVRVAREREPVFLPIQNTNPDRDTHPHSGGASLLTRQSWAPARGMTQGRLVCRVKDKGMPPANSQQ